MFEDIFKNLLLVPVAIGSYKAATTESNGEKLFWGAVAAGAGLAYLNTGQPPFEDTPVPTGSIDASRVARVASALWESLTGYDLDLNPFNEEVACQALGQFAILSNAEFVSVANFYKNTNLETIRQSIAALFLEPCGTFDPIDHKVHVIIRLDELNIP